jgi:hypothetical protein
MAAWRNPAMRRDDIFAPEPSANRIVSLRPANVMGGLSRPKDGVASLAYGPAIPILGARLCLLKSGSPGLTFRAAR